MAEAAFRRNDSTGETDPALAEIVRRLVAAYEPECIYLFGSRARGDAGPDSDYDLLVVVPDDAPPERRRSRLAYEVLWGSAPPRMCWYAPVRSSTVGCTCARRFPRWCGTKGGCSASARDKSGLREVQ